MKAMAKFTQTNGLPLSIDPGTVSSVEGELGSEHRAPYTVISHGKDGDQHAAVTATHDEVMEALKAADTKNVAIAAQQEQE